VSSLQLTATIVTFFSVSYMLFHRARAKALPVNSVVVPEPSSLLVLVG
jgi:hypothetical protein